MNRTDLGSVEGSATSASKSGRLARCLLVHLAVGLVCATGASGTLPSSALATTTLPPIGHVWVIDLENNNYFSAGDPNAPYESEVLPARGALLSEYYATGHNSLDNYIAQVSGQAPDPSTQEDCSPAYDFGPSAAGGAPMGADGQAVGQGCFLPANVKSLANQLDAASITWKGYMQSMDRVLADSGGTACGHANTGNINGAPNVGGNYLEKHDPFVWFHATIDNDAACREHVVALDPALESDLRSVGTTPSFSWISPDMYWDGHDSSPTATSEFLEKYIPMILSSPAYQQDGMLVVTSDEAAGFDSSSCCFEVPGPNSPGPGVGAVAGNTGDGGGRVGAVVLSPFVNPGTVVNPQAPGGTCASATCTGAGFYNHYSLLRTIEDIFHLGSNPKVPSTDGSGHLGFAGTYSGYPGPGEFGCEVFTGYAPCQGGSGNRQSMSAAPLSGSTGPRAEDGSSSWLSPAAQGNDLRAVACPSSAICLAVGQAGSVLSSADGGSSWSLVPSGAVEDLQGISCPTTSTCIAVGAHGTVLSLTASGARWTVSRLASHTTAQLNSVSCTSSARCVVVGDNVILSTTDGGNSWNAPASAPLPALGPASTPELLSVSCQTDPATTDAVCYAVGSFQNPQDPHSQDSQRSSQTGDPLPPENVFKTTDGGIDWVAQNTSTGFVGPQRLRSITCSDVSHCLAVGEAGTVVTTDSGGATWTLQAPPGDGSASEFLGYGSYLLDGATCGSAGACLIVGDRPTPYLGASGDNSLGSFQAITLSVKLGSYGSSTGNTWAVEQPSSFDRLSAAACPSTDLCVAVGDHGSIVRSTDALHADAASAWSQIGGNIDETLYGMACAGATGCVTVGGASPLLAREEGPTALAGSGASGWHMQHVPTPSAVGPSPGTRLAAVACPAADACVAAGSGGIIARESSGSWSSTAVDLLHLPPGPNSDKPTEDLLAVSCAPTTIGLDSASCVAVGEHGAVVASTNGGQSWTAQQAPSSASLTSVSCPVTGTCVAVGSQGTILTTNDGSTWASTISPTTSYLSGVSCATATDCMAVGSTGTVLRTSDGGATWSKLASPSGDDLYAVSCASPSHCVAVGSAGTVASTADGGNGWTLQGTGTADALRSVSCPSQGQCFAAGDYGALLAIRPEAVARDQLSVTKAGPGQGAVTSSPAGIDCGSDCSHAFVDRTMVILTATPSGGSSFGGWGGDCAAQTATTCTLTMDAAKNVSATFDPPGQSTRAPQTLTVTKAGTGRGLVTSAPPGIVCGSRCFHQFATGAAVTLTARPARGSFFAGWLRLCVAARTQPCRLTISVDRSLAAVFTRIVHAPDGMIRLTNTDRWVGRGIRNRRGVGQTLLTAASRRSTRTFSVRFANAGNVRDSIRVRGCRRSRAFKVRYFVGWRDITAQVLRGSYRLTNLKPGAYRTLAMRITLTSQAPAKSTLACAVTGTSATVPAALDRVNAQIWVRSRRASPATPLGTLR